MKKNNRTVQSTERLILKKNVVVSGAKGEYEKELTANSDDDANAAVKTKRNAAKAGDILS